MKALANFDPRNEFRLLPEKGGRPGLSIKKIQDFSLFEDFRCGSPPKPGEAETDIDDFIHNDAYRYYKDKLSSTYGLFFRSTKDRLLSPLCIMTLFPLAPVLLLPRVIFTPNIRLSR